MQTESTVTNNILAGIDAFLDAAKPQPAKTGMRFPESYRRNMTGTAYESHDGCPFGCFVIPPHRIDKTRHTRNLKVIACMADPAQGIEWDHVSVSLLNNPKDTPTWVEMCLVKDLFWSRDLTVIQFHPSESEYVNMHDGCLHLWRHATNPTQLPPRVMV